MAVGSFLLATGPDLVFNPVRPSHGPGHAGSYISQFRRPGARQLVDHVQLARGRLAGVVGADDLQEADPKYG